MTEVELLKAARAKVEQGWCQNVFAQNENGHMVPYTDERACAWCISGALIVASFGESETIGCRNSTYNAAYRRLYQRTKPFLPPEFNDEPGRTKDEVLALFDQVIKDAEEGVWIS